MHSKRAEQEASAVLSGRSRLPVFLHKMTALGKQAWGRRRNRRSARRGRWRVKGGGKHLSVCSLLGKNLTLLYHTRRNGCPEGGDSGEVRHVGDGRA